MKDEELQSRIEKGEPIGDLDSRAYAKIFGALRREPEFQVPINLAERVVRQIDFSSRQSSSDLVWLYSGLAACLVALVVAVGLTDFKINFGAFMFISEYPGLFVFGVLFVLGLQWIDRKIVRKTV